MKKNKKNYVIPFGQYKGKVPYGYHEIDKDDICRKLSKKFSITQGNLAIEFGEKVAEFTGAKHGLAVSSGTANFTLVCMCA